MSTDLLSPLAAWAAQAGCSRLVRDDAVVIADEGGEIRFYVRGDGAQWVVSRAERAEDEAILMTATDVTAIERHLTEQIGWDVRARRAFSQIFLPYQLDAVAPGYRIDASSEGWATLVDVKTGRAVADLLHTGVPYRAVSYSWYADARPEDLRSWSSDPYGGALQQFVAQK